MMIHGSHEFPLVALSILIAICASYTALTLAGRVTAAQGRVRTAWLLCGSIAMGSGIWSMHFVAMLAFHLPMAISYDIPLVTLSWLVAVGASAFALFVASRATVGLPRLFGAGVCLGLAVVAMHYTGMAAVRVPAHLSYNPLLVGASVAIAVTAATVALALFLWLRNDDTRRGRILRIGAAVVMGFAIAGMHYTAMAAAQFSESPAMTMPTAHLLGTAGLAVPVIMGAFVIIALTLLGSITDHWVRAKLASAEALRESEERYRTVVSEIDEVIFRADGEGRWVFLNPAWTQITGFTPDESLGVSILEFVHANDREISRDGCRKLREGGTDFTRHEVRYLTKDRGPRWVEVHARATRDAQGTVIGTAGVIRDVTERRQTEEAVRAAREAAEAASRAKSEFLSRMSHELRTPLNAIIGFGQLMELDANTPSQSENADHVLKAGRHLLALINEVLDITGIESGRLHLSTEPVRASDAAQEALSLIAPLAAARRIELVPISPTMAEHFVHADRQRLKQVLLNLCANAVKYNRDGGRVHVTCEPFGDNRMRIIVTDTGHGITADKLPRLFTPFDRLGAEQTGSEGTGLGLALSRRLAEAMGGSMGIQTVAGKGSSFWVELPRAESPLARTERADEVPTEFETTFNARRVRILYVEDNLSNLTLVQRILARHPNVELIPCMQGGLALDLARLHRPDMVLLDLHLPDMSGQDVLVQLRQTIDCRTIPIVVLSADATQGQRERLLGAGAYAYITKPLEVRPFMRILDEVLSLTLAA